MKKTGRLVTLTGIVAPTDSPAQFTNNGRIQQVFMDEREGYGYKVTRFTCFPNSIPLSIATGPALSGIAVMNLYTYDERELREINSDGNAVLAILGYPSAVSSGNMLPAQNGRCIATFCPIDTPTNNQNGNAGLHGYEVVKKDNFVVQALSIGIAWNIAAGYLIELEEYEITPDEEILLLLAQKVQVVG